VALLRKVACNLRHPMSLRHSVELTFETFLQDKSQRGQVHSQQNLLVRMIVNEWCVCEWMFWDVLTRQMSANNWIYYDCRDDFHPPKKKVFLRQKSAHYWIYSVWYDCGADFLRRVFTCALIYAPSIHIRTIHSQMHHSFTYAPLFQILFYLRAGWWCRGKSW